jgi:hypothetical protein
MLIILDEAAERLAPLLKELDRLHVPTQVWSLDQSAAHRVGGGAQYPVALYYCRASPSARMRGRPHAHEEAAVLVHDLAAAGRRVINGAGCIDHEMCKWRQMLLLQRCGITTPETRVVVGDIAQVRAALLQPDLRLPVFFKPCRGGSGHGVHRFESRADVDAWMARYRNHGPNALANFYGQSAYIIQGEVCDVADDPYVYRLEFVGRHPLYILRIDRSRAAQVAYNLCPTCPTARGDAIRRAVRDDGRQRAPLEPGLDLETLLDKNSWFTVLPLDAFAFVPELVGKCQELMRRTHSHVAAFEFALDPRTQRPVVYDINWNCNWNKFAEQRAQLPAYRCGCVALARFLRDEHDVVMGNAAGGARAGLGNEPPRDPDGGGTPDAHA